MGFLTTWDRYDERQRGMISKGVQRCVGVLYSEFFSEQFVEAIAL